MNRIIRALRLFALGAREGVPVNIAHEPIKTKPKESALEYLVRTTVLPASSVLRSPKTMRQQAAHGASRSPANSNAALGRYQGVMVNRAPTLQNPAVPLGIVTQGSRTPLTQPKQAPNLTPIPAIMQELYHKVLVKGHALKVLSQHNGVYSITVSNPSERSERVGTNTIYTFGPEGISRIPATFEQHDHIKVTRLA